MRVEQRIGRIDRLGQKHREIRIFNLHYRDTVEADIYQVLSERINLFEGVVGHLQPILAKMSGTITRAVLEGRAGVAAERAELAKLIEQQASETASGLDIGEAVDTEMGMPERPSSPLTMDDLDRVIRSPQLMPEGVKVRRLGDREYAMRAPGMDRAMRVTTNPEYFEEQAESVQLWSPGSRLFRPPTGVKPQGYEWKAGITLKDILNEIS